MNTSGGAGFADSGGFGLTGALEEPGSAEAKAAAAAHGPSEEELLASRAVKATKESVQTILCALSSADVDATISDALLGLPSFLTCAYDTSLTLPHQAKMDALNYLADQAMDLEASITRAAKRFSTDTSFEPPSKRVARSDLIPVPAPATGADAPVVTPRAEDSAEPDPPAKVHPQARFEPFFIQVTRNWMEIIRELNSLVDEPVNSKLVGELVKIVPRNVTEYRTIQNFCSKKNLEFASFSPRDERVKKVAIRGLPSFVDPAEVTAGLTSLGFTVVRAHGINHKKTKAPLNIFLAYLYPTDNWESVYKVSNLCFMQVSIRAFNSKGVRQCYNCQRFNHSSFACNFGPRCVKCAGSHTAKACPNTIDIPPKCCLCGLAHTANYSGCAHHPSNAIKSRSNYQTQERRQGPLTAPNNLPLKQRAPVDTFIAAPPPSNTAWSSGPPNLKTHPAPISDEHEIVQEVAAITSATATPSKRSLLSKVQSRRKKARSADLPPTEPAPPAREASVDTTRAQSDGICPSVKVRQTPAPSDGASASSSGPGMGEFNAMRSLSSDVGFSNTIKHYISVLREIRDEICLYEDEGDRFMAFFDVYERHFCVGNFFDGE